MSSGKHVAVPHRPRGHWFGRGRTRALLTLGSVAMLGAVGTSAYWTDTATITGGTIQAGKMDLQVAQTTAGPWNSTAPSNADWADADIAVSNLVPGGSQAFPLAVRNFGDADFKLTSTVKQGTSTGSPWGFVGNPIAVHLYRGGIPTNSSTSFPPSGTCQGGSSLGSAATVTASGSPLITTPEPVTHGNSEALCLVVSMDPNAGNDSQGASGQLSFLFKADQVTS